MGSVGWGFLSSSGDPFLKTCWLWQDLDNLGAHSLWVSDHLTKTFKPEGEYREAWTLLAALSQWTHHAKLGVLCSNNTFRHPSLLTRMIISLQDMSYNRLILGLGAGWYNAEYHIMGIPKPKSPIKALYDSLKIVQNMLQLDHIQRLDTTTYNPIQNAIIRPKGMMPPVLLGGHGNRIIEIAAARADIYNTFGTPEEVKARFDYLDHRTEMFKKPKLEKTVFILRGVAHDDHPDMWSSVEAFNAVVDQYRDCNPDGWIFDAPTPDQMGVLHQCLPTLNQLIG